MPPEMFGVLTLMKNQSGIFSQDTKMAGFIDGSAFCHVCPSSYETKRAFDALV